MRVVAWMVIATSWAGMAQSQTGVFERAVKALNDGDYAAAESGFREVLATSPQHVGAMQNLGLVYSRTNRLDEAVAVYREALSVKPSDAGLLTNLGLAYLKKGSFTDALPVFQRLMDGHRDVPAAHDTGLLYLLTAGYLKQNPTPDGRRAVGALLGLVPAAPASLVLCKIYFDSGRYQEAEEQCRKTLTANAAFPGAHRELGKTLVSEHSPEAETELTAAIAQDPGDSVAVYYYGLALLQDAKVDASVPQFERAIHLDPTFWGSYYYLGRVRLQLQQADQAVPLLRKAAELNASEPLVLYELGRALMATGKAEEAEQSMQRVRELRAQAVEHDVLTLRKK